MIGQAKVALSRIIYWEGTTMTHIWTDVLEWFPIDEDLWSVRQLL